MAVREPWRMMAKAGSVARQPRGGGRPVMVIPGFTANDASTFPLRSYLSGLGYECRGWGLGVNSGDLQTQVPQTLERIAAWYQDRSSEHPTPISLVGWSLGGVDRPGGGAPAPRPDRPRHHVRHAVVGAAPHHDLDGTIRPARRVRTDASPARNRQPILRPVTAIYSRNDGVVHWKACVDPDPNTVNIEVSSSHIGLGIDPDVWVIVASTLGARA